MLVITGPSSRPSELRYVLMSIQTAGVLVSPSNRSSVSVLFLYTHDVCLFNEGWAPLKTAQLSSGLAQTGGYIYTL